MSAAGLWLAIAGVFAALLIAYAVLGAVYDELHDWWVRRGRARHYLNQLRREIARAEREGRQLR